MTPERLLRSAILPALAELSAQGIPDTYDARRFLLAIALQESGLKHRRQVVDGAEEGPAASFWQFEKNGGCRGVTTHPSAVRYMSLICEAYNVNMSSGDLWQAIQFQDIVAAAAARLLIYTLPSKLPTLAATGWAQYVSAWRPGKPRPESWTYCWNTATAAVDALHDVGG